MNTPALRHSARQFTGWLLAAVTGVYVWSAVFVEKDRPSAIVFAVVFASFTVCVFVWRYREHNSNAERYAEATAYAVTRADQLAEHEAMLARSEADREDRERARNAQIRDDVLSGRRCPAWCDDCDEDRRRTDEENARWLAERARSHGHPNAGDLEILDAELGLEPTSP